MDKKFDAYQGAGYRKKILDVDNVVNSLTMLPRISCTR